MSKANANSKKVEEKEKVVLKEDKPGRKAGQDEKKKVPAAKDKATSKGEEKGEKEGGKKRKTSPERSTSPKRPRRDEIAELTKNKRLQVSTSKRERKPVERLEVVLEKKREVIIRKGKGTPLKDIPNVEYMIRKTSRNDEHLGILHTLLFGQSKRLDYKAHLLSFSGVAYDDDEEEEAERTKLQGKLEGKSIAQLKEILKILDQPVGGTKPEIIKKLLTFLFDPTDSGNDSLEKKDEKKKDKKKKKAEKNKKKAKSTKKKAKSTKKKTTKRAKASSEEEEEEEEEEKEEEGSDYETEKEKPATQSKKRKASSPAKKSGPTKKASADEEEKQEEEKEEEEDSEALKKLKSIVKDLVGTEGITVKAIRSTVFSKLGDNALVDAGIDDAELKSIVIALHSSSS